jgi:hypothetical protein
MKFTRYLYEFNQVKYSLYYSLLDRKREESLFWAYELYHSGFKYDAWCSVRDFYVNNYANYNIQITNKFDKLYSEWKETENDLLLGTVINTISILPDQSTEKRKKIFILLYTEDKHKTQSVKIARNYLKEVCKYSIRTDSDSLDSEDSLREAYLGNWLNHCIETPIWKERIQMENGQVLDNKVVFEDDDLDTFYNKWGFEPDEQSIEMHNIHGVNI